MSIIQEIAECERNGIPVALCSIVSASGSTPRHAGSKMLVFPDGHISGTIGGGELEQVIIHHALQSLEDGITRLIPYEYVVNNESDEKITSGSVEVFIDPIQPKITLVVVGGGHIGQKVVSLAHWLGYRVILSDEREVFCDPNKIPGADAYFCCKMADLPAKISVNHRTCFVLSTQNADIDIEGLPSILATTAPYIGVIGSRRRWEATKKGLIEKGVDPEQLSRVRSPIGLDIHAETPQEIAVSILSEIILLTNTTHKNNR
ncbi:MAG: XdhC family protein [Anaerolineaceae bacterium]|nr:XdhC family protein [Anaerolineaceae bacterium]